MRLPAWQYLLSGTTAAALLLAASVRGDDGSRASPDAIDFSKLSDSDDEVHTWTLSAFYGYETFRGYPEGNWQNNGLNAGFNFGSRLGDFSDTTGIGFQIGGSIGIYNWSGTDYRMRDNDQAETQGFFTVGFFRKASENCPWDAGAVFDLMVNNNYGVYNETPTLAQFRYRLGYAFCERDEIGIWGAVHCESSTRDVGRVGPVTWIGEDQINLFSHHKWEFGADTSVWIGVPLGQSMSGGGSLGSFIAGARGDMPLNDWMSIYSLVTYMRPAVGAGPVAAERDEWSFVIGLSFFFRKDSRTPTVANEGWSPLLPVASNGTFFVDTNHAY
jgi:hypothetical protein